MIKVKIPTPLRRFTKDLAEVEVEAADVKSLIEALEKKCPGIRKRLCEDDGSIRKFINVYVGDEDIRFLKGIETKIAHGKEISIVPSIAGG